MPLPAPLPTRTVEVRVLWADGTSLTKAQKGDQVLLELIEEYAYSIGAQWKSLDGKEMQLVDSRPVERRAGEAGTVEIRLSGNRPNSQ